MSDVIYRPVGADLWKKPKDLERELKAEYAGDKGIDWRDVMPDSIAERLDDYAESTRKAFKEVFGIEEIPAELTAEMESILGSITSSVKKNGYVEEISDEVFVELQKLAIKVLAYREKPTEISVEDIPEVGYKITYTTKDGERVDREMNAGEQYMLFNMEMWADQCNQLENVEGFKNFLKKAKDESANLSGDKKQEEKFLKLIYRRYEKFGFTRVQINNLLILSESEETFPELFPDGKDPGINKLEIMRDVWNQYLSEGEKSKYIKLAAAVIGIGALEGTTPMLFKYMLDAKTTDVLALFAGAYMAGEASLGGVKQFLGVKFDAFLNSVTQRRGGLNEKLSADLVSQPGEVMAATQERGRLLTAMNRGRSAFKDILASVAQSTGPAIASTATGLGMMMVTDWRLGLISLATAPIAISIARQTEKKLEPTIAQTQETEASIALEVEEQIGAHMEIVLSGMRDSMGHRLNDSMAKINQLANDRSAAEASMEFRMGSLLYPAITAGLVAAGVALRKVGVQESGTIIATLMYSGIFQESFFRIMREQTKVLEGCASVIEMEQVFNGYAEEEARAEKNRKPASELSSFSIEMRGVNLVWENKKLINNVNFSILGGSVVQLEGMSGQGKTTLTKLMAGYYSPTSGEVLVGGVPIQDIRKSGSDSLYAHIAYLSQKPYIFGSENLRNNLAFGNHGASEDAMKQVLKEMSLEERFAENGAINLESSIANISGGESMRLALARVLLKIRAQKNGGIVFLDEPTAGLDQETAKEITEILVREKNKHPKITFIVVSHDPSFIDNLENPRGIEQGLTIQKIKLHGGKIVEKEKAVKDA